MEQNRSTVGHLYCTPEHAEEILASLSGEEFAAARSERVAELDRAAKRVVQPLVDSAAGEKLSVELRQMPERTQRTVARLDEGKECT